MTRKEIYGAEIKAAAPFLEMQSPRLQRAGAALVYKPPADETKCRAAPLPRHSVLKQQKRGMRRSSDTGYDQMQKNQFQGGLCCVYSGV
jgi:hypothetical protein